MSDAFARFVAEVLAAMFPGLHRFPDAGKDGAIDFSSDLPEGRVVGECKVVGSDSFADVQARWREVVARLRRNIVSPDGPPVGQSQYAPWYSSDPAIFKYVFCTTAVIKNQGRLDQLKKEIRDDLRGLGRSHPHLAHLSRTKVLVVDWHKLFSLASDHTKFRWFLAMRPNGLVPLEISSRSDAGTFREYLMSDRMPYYSLKEHLEGFGGPVDAELLHEELLIDGLAGPDRLGLLIAGAGGLGKSRLTLEIGRAAAQRDWLVLRAHPPLPADALDELASTIDRSSRVLLLFDYIETQPGFATLADRLYALNATQELSIRYVANCRTSYLATVSGIRDQRVVDLSPVGNAPTASWRHGYRSAAVDHILDHSGLEADKRASGLAKDRPILAVLLAYLQATGREGDLHELLGSGDFGAWVSKRTELSFGGPGITRDLALLCGLMPIREEMAGLPLDRFQSLVDRFAADGWIERGAGASGESEWRAIHDVITDQVVVSYLSSIPHTTGEFARDLFDLASRCDSVDSALISLQRLADVPQVRDIDWTRVLNTSLASAPQSWQSARDLLMETSLLRASDVLTLLAGHDKLWDEMHRDVRIQDSLGRLADRSNADPNPLTETQETTLVDWLTRGSSVAEESNFVLTRGLQRCPTRVDRFAVTWLDRHWHEPQAGFVLSAWLDTDLDTERIRRHVERWLYRFGVNRLASFVIASWLSRTKEPEFARKAVEAWLAEHADELEAQFVFKAWLDAGGERELVRDRLRYWLADHGRDGAVDFVCKAWLGAGGEIDVVRDPVRDWMITNATEVTARFLFEGWLDAEGDLDVVRDPVRQWLGSHGTDATAHFVFKAWLDAGGERALVRDPIRRWLAAHPRGTHVDFVCKAWLRARGDSELVRDAVYAWLADHATDVEARFVLKAWLDAHGDLGLIREPVRDWLKLNRAHFTADYVLAAWLVAGGELEVVREPVRRWLTNHDKELNAHYVLTAWLHAKGEREMVREPLTSWLSCHASAYSARSVRRAWLDAGGEPSVVASARSEHS